MTARSKSAIKAFFTTGSRPTQIQFGDFIDSYQDVNTTLTVLASATTGAVGLQLLSCVTSASAQNVFGLGALAFVSSVGTNNLDNLAVTTSKLANLAVTTSKLSLTTVSAGSYTAANVTIGVDGRITTASNGSITQKVAQVVSTQTGAVATGTTATPYDDTIPQSNEGDQYMSLAITPTNASSTLIIEVNIAAFGHSASNQATVALFQDSGVNAIAAQAFYLPSTSGTNCLVLRYVMTAGTTSATTFAVRIGSTTGATTTFNGQAGGRKYGGVLSSSIVITEYTP